MNSTARSGGAKLGDEMIRVSIEDELLKRRVSSRNDASTTDQRPWTIAIGVFFSLGVVALFMGLLLAAESYVGLGIDSLWVGNVSALLLIVSCLLLSVGANCSDKVGSLERERLAANSTTNN